MIGVDVVAAVAERVKQQGVDESVLGALRQEYPDVHFTYCSDDDITSGKPVSEHEGFNLYLVDGREHCLCLTNDHDNATGLVVAEIFGEDD